MRNEALGYSVPRCCPTHVRRSHQVGEFQANALGQIHTNINTAESAFISLGRPIPGVRSETPRNSIVTRQILTRTAAPNHAYTTPVQQPMPTSDD